MVCSKVEIALCAVVAGQKLKAFRAMQKDLSGKMICRDRPPSHDLLPSVSVKSRAMSSIPPSLCFGRPIFDAIKQPVCLEPALSVRPRCFEHWEGMALLLGAPRCPHHDLDRCLGCNVRMVGFKISCCPFSIFTFPPASCFFALDYYECYLH